jgi:uncharacterized membrane protein YhaH (DUF805 family)
MAKVFRSYFIFQGRISRSGFWLRNLIFWPLLYVALIVVSIWFGENIQRNYIAENFTMTGNYILASFAAIFVWVWTCSEIQRWHDLNRSGWWYWVRIIPGIGAICVMAKCGFQRGTIGPNKYGPDPLEPK